MTAFSFTSALRHALAGFAVGAVALIGVQQLSAQGLGGHDSNAPVNYAADRIELQDRQDRVVLSGNVDVTQGGLRLRTARVTVAFTNEGALKIQRMDATGGVLVTRGNESARGNVAIYDFNRRIITMAGNVRLRRGTDTLNGGRLVIDLQSGLSTVDGNATGTSSSASPSPTGQGRVTGTFTVPQDRNKPQ